MSDSKIAIKHYPPVIEGTIPAFYGTTLVVPYSMNRAVGKNDIVGFCLKIKTVQTNTFVANLTSKSYDTTQASFDISELVQRAIKDQEGEEITDDIPADKLVAGQYYKIQLAYIANDVYKTIGHYSTVGVIKYYGLQGPKIYVDGLSDKRSNLFAGYYLGVFEHEDDPMEKIARYRFTITYSGTDEIFYDTGWVLHNTINDVDSLSANDIFKYTDDLDGDKTYYLQYKVITSNNMECASPKYNILQKESVGTTLNLEFTAQPDYDNGFVLLKLKSLGAAGDNSTLTGAFEISRQNIKNPKHWEIIDLFILQNEVATRTYWRDFTVTHGETYRYAIRQFNEAGVYTNRVLSNEIFVDFEDAYLFDGQRQLKIKYNPKVSSFKNDIPESKTDTIGSKYPFIFRNGHVNYKEFPISGLISYFSDEQELFLTNEDIGIVDITNWSRSKTAAEEELPENAKTTDLTSHNISAERKFKLEVLEWLTNGKPKLFRSPAEGNYIVRLLNTNLTPTDTVGRMLHTFNCTAYEIAECNYDNLVNYGFIDNGLSEDEKQRKYYRTVPLGWQTHENDEYGYIPIITGENPDYPMDEDGYIELLKDPYGQKVLHAYAIYFDDMNSGDIILVNGEERIIGNTGQFILEKTDDINSVKVKAIKGIAYFHPDDYENAMNDYNNIVNNHQQVIDNKIAEITSANAALEEYQDYVDNQIDGWAQSGDIQIEDDETIIDYDNQIAAIQEDMDSAEADIAYYDGLYNTAIANVSNYEGQIDYQRQLSESYEEQIDTYKEDYLYQEKTIKNEDLQTAILEYNDLNEEIEYLDSHTQTEVNTEYNNKVSAYTNCQLEVQADEAVLYDGGYCDQFISEKRAKEAYALELYNDHGIGNGSDTNWTVVDTVPSGASGSGFLVCQSIDTKIGVYTTTINTSNTNVTSITNSVKTAAQSRWNSTVANKVKTRALCLENLEASRANLTTLKTNFKAKKIEIDDAEYNGATAEQIRTLKNQLSTIAASILEEEEAISRYEEALVIYEEEYDAIESNQAQADLYTAKKNRLTEIRAALLTNNSALTLARDGIRTFLSKHTEFWLEPYIQPEVTIELIQAHKNEWWSALEEDEDKLAAAEAEKDKWARYKADKGNLTNVKKYLIALGVQKSILQAELDALGQPSLGAMDAQIGEWTQAKNTADQEKERLNGLLTQERQNRDGYLASKTNAQNNYNSYKSQQDAVKAQKRQYIQDLVAEAHAAQLAEFNQELLRLQGIIDTLNADLERIRNMQFIAPKREDYVYSDAETENYILEDYNGLFTYKYSDIYANSFDLISGQTLVDVPCKQFIGADMSENVLDSLIDIRTELLNVLQIQADLKQFEDIYTWKDTSSFDNLSLNYEQFNDYFSFDKNKMPGENNDKGYSYGDLTNQIFNPQKNSLYIYRIHPIYQHKDYNLDDEIPIGYIETLSPWEKEELRQQVVEMLSRYNLTLNQIGDFVRYKNIDETIIYTNPRTQEQEEKTIDEMIKIIKLTVDDFLLLEKYFGKEEFHYNTSGDDPAGSVPDEISVYKNGEWKWVPVEYLKNEGYYVDATYYSVNPYNEYNKYRTFNDGEDYYLIYKDGYYKVVHDYSARIYINTGASEGVTEANGELYTAEGQLLQPYIDLAESGSFKTTLIPEITDIYVGDGVILNLSYQAREIEYIIESTDEKLQNAKKTWEDAIKGYTDCFYTRKNTAEELYDYRDEDWRENYESMLWQSKYTVLDNNTTMQRYQYIKDCEEAYLELLAEKIKRYKEERGIE